MDMTWYFTLHKYLFSAIIQTNSSLHFIYWQTYAFHNSGWWLYYSNKYEIYINL